MGLVSPDLDAFNWQLIFNPDPTDRKKETNHLITARKAALFFNSFA